MLTLDVIHDVLPGRWPELRFDSSMTIWNLKERMQRHTGTSPAAMAIYSFDEKVPGKEIALLDDSMTLCQYGVSNGMTLLVRDLDKQSVTVALSNQYRNIHQEGEEEVKDREEGDSSIIKVRMSDEDYDKKENSMRKFMAKLRQDKPELFRKKNEGSIKGVAANVGTNNIGTSNIGTSNIGTNDTSRTNSEIIVPSSDNNASNNRAPVTILSAFQVGQRCKINESLLGCIKFVGEATPASGKEPRKKREYIGIILDEPLSLSIGDQIKIDEGEVDLLDCPIAYKLWVSKDDVSTGKVKIEVGDFPPIDIFDSDVIN